MGVSAINALLPRGSVFDRVGDDGRVLFIVEGMRVPTIALSDGYRSVLALAGDLIWRLIQAFPDSTNPLAEPGVVLIDELDIHLHPSWHREIPGWLRAQFPNLQFFVATHSPLIAAGAGADALTLRFEVADGATKVDAVPNVAALNVDRILQSPAFGLDSPYSPSTTGRLARYDQLLRRGSHRSGDEDREFEQLQLFVETARPLGGPPEPGSLNDRIDRFLEKQLSDKP